MPPRSRRQRLALALAGAVGVVAGVVTLAAATPESVLQAEFARQRWLAGASEHTLDAAGHHVAYLEAGDPGAPTLVLVHGFVGSKENWLLLMRELADDWHVIAPDLPGWGDSGRDESLDYGPVAQADRLAGFLRALPSPPAMVVGHSMGGQVVGLMAARHPGLAPRLTLMSSAGVTFRENDFARAVLAGGNPYQVGNRADLKRFLGMVFAEPPFVPWPADEALVRRRIADAAFEQRVLDAIGRGPEALLLETLLPGIAAPTLLLWCRDDQVIDVSAVDTFRAGLPRSEVVLLEGCGHMPMMARPAEVAAALAGFARRPAP